MRAVLLLSIAAAACGDGIAAPDATIEVDASRGLVRVRTEGFAPGASQVFFQNKDSSLVLSTRTGLDGTANAYMAPGGFVTVVVPTPGGTDLYTWFDVQPGDEFVVGTGVRGPGSIVLTVPVTVPVDPGQQNYHLATACGQWNLAPPFNVTTEVTLAGCSELQDMLVMNHGSQLANERYLYGADIRLDGSPIVLDGPYRAFETARIEVSGAPAKVLDMNAFVMVLDDGYPIPGSERAKSFSVTGGQGATGVPMPMPPGSSLMISTQPGFTSGPLGQLRVVLWGPAKPLTSIDLATLALRAYTAPPTYAREQHALRWSEAAEGVQADVVVATWGWFDVSLGGNYTWHVLAPHSGDSMLALPKLPLPELMPRPDDQILEPTSFTTIKADGGYSALRTRLPITWFPGQTWRPTSAAAGSVSIQELGGQLF